MSETSLKEYVETHGQSETARRAGLTQGAIWQMLDSHRQVFVTELDDGTVTLHETKQIKRTVA